MQTGQLVYREELFDLDALVQEIVENIQGTTQTHHLLLDGQAQAESFGDRDRIGQVLINLLNNAIKYSPNAKTVDVFIETAQEQVFVKVRDYGIGIPREHQGKIFDRFYRVSDGASPLFPGLGMGLYIACEVVMRHGGEITVESEESKGSTFLVTLPLKNELL